MSRAAGYDPGTEALRREHRLFRAEIAVSVLVILSCVVLTVAALRDHSALWQVVFPLLVGLGLVWTGVERVRSARHARARSRRAVNADLHARLVQLLARRASEDRAASIRGQGADTTGAGLGAPRVLTGTADDRRPQWGDSASGT